MSEWKLVPVEPTDEMIKAIDGLICSSYLWPVYAYRAMIDAAPVPVADDCDGILDCYAAENQQFSAELARLRAENELLKAALDNVRLLAGRAAYRNEGWSIKLRQFCADAGVTGSPFRAPTAPPAR